MKESLLATLTTIVFCVLLPAAAAKQGTAVADTGVPVLLEEVTEASMPSETETDTAPPKQTQEGIDELFSLPVLLPDGSNVSMSLHDYLVGALLGEMPMKFEMEALKAQAVACRTYALKRYDGRKHSPAAVCTLSACCESWVSPEEYEAEYGSQWVAKAEEAVSQTDGLVLMYDGALIDATFFACSGGQTEAAVAVWGTDVPYLQSVESPGEEAAAKYESTVTVSLEEFARILEAQGAALGEDTAKWLGQVRYTEGGGVAEIEIGGAAFTGKQMRKLFSLNSTDFEISIGETVEFTTHGYGHRVGMSQYGANAMAASGGDFREILAWYYRDTQLERYSIY